MEINAKQARAKLSSLLKRVEEGDEVVVLRRGKRIARLVPAGKKQAKLPSLKEFRASIRVKGEAMSLSAIQGREKERF
ncbi:MAG TPA: type II toxin-antitoxin system prevent-host-death family antitoxin [Thermodesulfobacteriota bacterium]|nr:type II toxin-antitoxin system prevent-host-death family antitoxin [Thermodesulfobacteriota bacterium]